MELKKGSFMDRPKVGISVFLFNEKNQFLVGKRKGSHGEGTYALPGGHLEGGETFSECAARELYEETNVRVNKEDLFFITLTNNIFEKENKHYVDIALITRKPEKETVINVEPEKCDGWFWVDYRNIPKEISDNFFLVTKNVLENAEGRIEKFFVL